LARRDENVRLDDAFTRALEFDARFHEIGAAVFIYIQQKAGAETGRENVCGIMEGKNLNSRREQILQRLRKNATEASPNAVLPSLRDFSIYRNFAPAQQNPLQIFAQKIAALKGEFYHVKNEAAAAKILRELLITNADADKKLVARYRHALLDRIFAVEPSLADNVQVIDHEEITSPDFADFSVGITAVDFLVARTGSIVLSTATAGGRRLSVLPPFHIAIATTGQLVVSLDDALKAYHERGESNRSSYATIITGPSRTSDIEKILVLGAHGPKRLAVMVVG
jgi:L-lactate dehydrogenase complex protein LldG